jgi:hypothetical protein
MKKRKLFLCISIALVALFVATNAQAITLSFDPLSQDVNLGEQVFVDLVISGLGDQMPDSLGMFDLDIAFDPSILAFNNAVYGDPVLGDQLDLWGLGSLTITTPGVGSVNLFELSFDFPSDLDTFQAGSFTLATLSFDTLSLGTSSLDITINSLSDAWGYSLIATTQSGSVNVIPEPGTLLLMSGGLLGVGYLRRKLR